MTIRSSVIPIGICIANEYNSIRQIILHALSTALEWLADGRDEAEVAAMLNIRTHRGDDLSDAARPHHGRAMGALREANSRDWVFQAGERLRGREEAERWLWAARATWLRGWAR